MGNQAEQTGRHFLRVSKDKSGRERSIDEQAFENEQAWQFTFVGEPYREVASASRYAKKQRNEFPRLISDLQTGRFGADVLVMWEGSRGSRKVVEWDTLIEQCAASGVRIAITAEDRLYDPAKPRDRKDLIDLANEAEYESARIAGRTQRSADAAVRHGIAVGQANYGYRRIYDPETRELVSQEPDPVEAPIVAGIYTRLAAGHSLRRVADDLNNRGVRTRTGAVWYTATVRRIATNVAYIGKRSHLSSAEWKTLPEPERRRRQVRSATSAWPPIVPEHQFYSVQRILGDPTRRTTDRPGRAVYEFSRTIRCDTCEGPLAVINYLSPTGHYRCANKGCVLTPKPPVDKILTDVLMRFLSRPDVVKQLIAGDDDPRIETARNEVAKIRAELDELYESAATGQASLTFQARVEPLILKRLEAAEQHLVELSTPSELRGLITPGAEVKKRWDAAPVSARRRIAKILFTPQLLGEPRIKPVERRDFTDVPVEERIVWRTAG